ncbi:MAG: Psb32 and founding s of phosphatase family protein [Candidatus Saccharibacteria bacterium]|nr:Psb32 and founding s of phosphatase family protein [Candidatus Saccharibacteria bacterium]MDB5181218.1 Psb32 and founding s of phosphatase family protein [Candidatus Saccharibacteria bacterium]
MFLKFVRLGLVIALFGFVAAGLNAVDAAALSVPARPTDIPIVDQTNTLTAEQKATLAQQIADERAKSGNQIVIVVVPSIENSSLEAYSLAIAREWGIGTTENNNGVLLLVVKNDRLLRIEVGTGLEGALTDVQSGRIIRNDISPLFRQEKYFEGIQAGLTSIIAAIHGEYTAESTAEQAASFPWELVFGVGFLIFSWLGSILARTKSWWAGGVIGGAMGGTAGLLTGSLVLGLVGGGALVIIGLLLDKAVSANYQSHARHGDKPSWWAGGGFLGGGGPRGGGGFGGFGGGGFGGGGSSGGW